MSLKENIEKSKIELANKFTNQERLEKNLERQRIEACRNKALILHEKSSELLNPYISLIESSDCLNILTELISLENLKDTRLDIDMVISNNKVKSKDFDDIGRLPYSVIYKNLDLSDGFLNFGKKNDWGYEKLMAINPEDLELKFCAVSLLWDYKCATGHYDGSDDYIVTEEKYNSLPIFFKPDSIEIRGLRLTIENVNKKSMEEAIANSYVKIQKGAE